MKKVLSNYCKFCRDKGHCKGCDIKQAKRYIKSLEEKLSIFECLYENVKNIEFKEPIVGRCPSCEEKVLLTHMKGTCPNCGNVIVACEDYPFNYEDCKKSIFNQKEL